MSKLLLVVLFQPSTVLIAIACAMASGYTLPGAMISVICEFAHAFQRRTHARKRAG